VGTLFQHNLQAVITAEKEWRWQDITIVQVSALFQE